MTALQAARAWTPPFWARKEVMTRTDAVLVVVGRNNAWGLVMSTTFASDTHPDQAVAQLDAAAVYLSRETIAGPKVRVALGAMSRRFERAVRAAADGCAAPV